VRNVGIPSRPDVSNFASLAPQWQENCGPVCLGFKLPDAGDNESAYMQCIPHGDDKLTGMFPIKVQLSK
jgi:hypothetical protein